MIYHPKVCLMTLDVIFLYTNIPHQDRLDAYRETLYKREVLDPPTEEIVQLTPIVLKKNSFSFDSLHDLQKQGTEMGTRMPPSYANIFMANLEQGLLQQTTQKPTIWWKYIDNIFAIWPHGEEKLQIY